MAAPYPKEKLTFRFAGLACMLQFLLWFIAWRTWQIPAKIHPTPMLGVQNLTSSTESTVWSMTYCTSPAKCLGGEFASIDAKASAAICRLQCLRGETLRAGAETLSDSLPPTGLLTWPKQSPQRSYHMRRPSAFWHLLGSKSNHIHFKTVSQETARDIWN